jgi:hypothetical protein
MITRDMETPIILGRLLLILAVFTVTSFPVLYAFSPWFKAWLGRAIMLQACTLALAIWLKFVLTFFLADGPRGFLLWTNVTVLVLINISTPALTILLWRIRRSAKRKAKDVEHVTLVDDEPAA